MGMYVIKKCPHCQTVYEEGHESRGIGRPFRKCSQCEGVIIDTDETEWELKSPLGKATYFLICGYTCIVYGTGFLLVASFAFKGLSTIDYMMLWAGGCVVALGVLIIVNYRDIEESQTRMADPKYRELLETLGLLKKSS